MAITFVLVENTPYRLRYLATQDGVISSPPVAADGFNTIPNDAGGTPDLRTDSAPFNSALHRIMRARLEAYPPLPAGALTQAQARALLASDDAAGAVLTNQNISRCEIRVTGRTGAVQWAVDANVDGQGDPVVEVRSETGTAATAYVDIVQRHSYDL
jgi:hypothetical protein